MTARTDPGFLPPHLVPFGIDEGGDLFCIDAGSQAICHFTVEDADDPDGATVALAESLQAFIDGLA